MNKQRFRVLDMPSHPMRTAALYAGIVAVNTVGLGLADIFWNWTMGWSLNTDGEYLMAASGSFVGALLMRFWMQRKDILS